MKKVFACIMAALAIASAALADDVFKNDRERWLRIAEESKPMLQKTINEPKNIVIAIPDKNAFQGWTYKSDTTSIQSLYQSNFKEINSVTLDFGEHLTGYFTFHIKTLTRTWDAPTRLRMTFGEVPAELNTPFDPWKGSLSRAWMQDETVEILENQIDTEITLPRRVSMRYLKIELLGSSSGYDFALDKMYFTAETSACSVQTKLQPGCPQIIKDIDRVGAATLKECMQTVYEDGPKRDHRLWIGDMYLESLANRYSYRNFLLTKRCLYLFAGVCDEEGRLISNLTEFPKPHCQYGSYLLPYSLLYISTLYEYYNDTKDIETLRDLWKICKVQMEEALMGVNDNGIYDLNQKPSWYFFDWRDGLEVSACMHACTIDALNITYKIAEILGYEKEVKDYPILAKKMKNAAKKLLYDKSIGMFRSGPKGQVSILSQAWMIKAGVITGKEAQQAIRNALVDQTVIMPGTPWGTHYLVDAMLICGMENEAREYLVNYWGSMVQKGADTFWEAYDPNDDFLSPYGFSPLNSYCHAWSCTPVYFIHKYPEIFQK